MLLDFLDIFLLLKIIMHRDRFRYTKSGYHHFLVFISQQRKILLMFLNVRMHKREDWLVKTSTVLIAPWTLRRWTCNTGYQTYSIWLDSSICIWSSWIVRKWICQSLWIPQVFKLLIHLFLLSSTAKSVYLCEILNDCTRSTGLLLPANHKVRVS